MYLVDHKVFMTFLNKKALAKNDLPILKAVPAIVEYKRDGVIMAKVEVMSIAEFNYLLKYGKIQKSSQNKYWIRGEEWKIVDGKPVMELKM